MRSAAATGLAALALACGEEAAPAPEPACALPARAQTAAVGFDANSDGIVDVADGTWLMARNTRGGADPPCLAAVEAFGDRVGDFGTAWAIWYSLLSGTAQPELAPGTCAAPAQAEAACGDGLALSIEAPASVRSGETFTARVHLSSPGFAVEAWSLSLSASGCRVTSASALGFDVPKDGLSIQSAEVSGEGGALSLVVLDPFRGGGVSGASEILAVDVAADTVTACAPCALSLADGQVGRGRPFTNVVASGGRSYAPPAVTTTVEVCP